MDLFPYFRHYAVAYAHKWAYSRNPDYYDFSEIGGDCTNFVSQCIFAGSGVMNNTPVYGWYYHDLNHRAPAWTGVDYLYNFLINNKGAGPFGVECSAQEVEPGDIIQLQTIGEGFHHTPIVVYSGLKPSIATILVAAHSIDCDYRLLTSYPINKIRFIHILGVRQ